MIGGNCTDAWPMMTGSRNQYVISKSAKTGKYTCGAKYNPQEEIKKLDMPVMIINGTKDIQVSLGESEKLKNARPDAVYVIIENMNHIFKEILGDSLENSKSYNEYNRPIIPILLEKIAAFVLE